MARNKIDSLERNHIIIGNQRIPISRKWKNSIVSEILATKLLKRL